MIYTKDEWSPLKKVVVGDASFANWPLHDPVFAKESEKTTWTQSAVPKGPVPKWIIDEANEDLDTLANTLRGLGVEVLRPTEMNFQTQDGLYNYCPRDRLLIYGDLIVDPSMMYPCRDMEINNYETILRTAKTVIKMPRNQGLILDAANVCRLGDSLLFLESPSGNRAAFDWLCHTLPDVNIELCNFYAGVHIDSTIVPLRKGTVMINASRVGVDKVPKVFDGWEKIWIHDVVAQDFYQYPYASKWIGMNLLVIDNSKIICDKNQHALIQTLENHGFDVIPLELRHSRTLGGGFHCVTLDLIRAH